MSDSMLSDEDLAYMKREAPSIMAEIEAELPSAIGPDRIMKVAAIESIKEGNFVFAYIIAAVMSIRDSIGDHGMLSWLLSCNASLETLQAEEARRN